MKKKISRRSFLRKSLTSAGILASAGIVLPEAVKGTDQKELATLIDIRKCIGCEECIDITHLGLVIIFALAALLCKLFNIWQIRQNRT